MLEVVLEDLTLHVVVVVQEVHSVARWIRGFHCTAGFEIMERQVGENEYPAVVREVNSLVILELEEAVVRDSELGTRELLEQLLQQLLRTVLLLMSPL